MAQTLYWDFKTKETSDVYDFIQNRLTQEPATTPRWFWLEPRPYPQSPQEFWKTTHPQCLVDTFPKTKIALDQAKVFYEDGMLHVIATDNGCRWFECSENKRLSREEQVIPANPYQVLLRRDYERFGLDKPSNIPDTIAVIEYYRDSQLFTWRIWKNKEK